MLSHIDDDGLNKDPALVTILEAIQLSGLSKKYLTSLLKKGTLEGKQVSDYWLIYTESLEHFLATRRKYRLKKLLDNPKQLNSQSVSVNGHKRINTYKKLQQG